MFYKNYIVNYTVYCYYCGVFIEKYGYTKFHRGLRLFIVVLQELQCLQNCYYHLKLLVSITSPSFVCLHLQVFEIAKCIA